MSSDPLDTKAIKINSDHQSSNTVFPIMVRRHHSILSSWNEVPEKIITCLLPVWITNNLI